MKLGGEPEFEHVDMDVDRITVDFALSSCTRYFGALSLRYDDPKLINHPAVHGRYLTWTSFPRLQGLVLLNISQSGGK